MNARNLLTLPLVLAAAVVGQGTTCDNLVPNSGFESLLFDPWAIKGPVTATYPQFKVDKAITSQCLELTSAPSFSVCQPTAFAMVAGVPYEVAINVWSNGPFGLDLGLSSGGQRTSVWSNTVQIGCSRIAVTHVPAVSGAYTFDLQISGSASGGVRHRFDDAMVRRNDVLFTFDGPRRTSSLNTFRVAGSPNANFAVFVSFSGFLAPFPIPGCSGGWQLQPPAYTLIVGTLGGDGVFTHNLFVPFGVGDVPLYWQAVTAPPSCAFGCPLVVGF